jgi:hypothetical protein
MAEFMITKYKKPTRNRIMYWLDLKEQNLNSPIVTPKYSTVWS